MTCHHEWINPENERTDANGYLMCRKCGKLKREGQMMTDVEIEAGKLAERIEDFINMGEPANEKARALVSMMPEHVRDEFAMLLDGPDD